ncbi:MAG: LamG domain-containing protein [Flammeovirgaceae bacterium]
MSLINSRTRFFPNLQRHLFPAAGENTYIFPKGSDGRLAFNDISGDASRAAILGTSIRFDGLSGTYAYFENTNLTIPVGVEANLTISLWCNFQGDTSDSAIYSLISFQENKQNSGQEFVDDYYASFLTSSNSLIEPTSNTPIPINTWNHLIIEFNADGTYRLYINGALKIENDLGNNINIAGNDLTIGAFWQNGNAVYNWNGYISDIRIWQRILTPTERTDVFNSNVLGDEVFHAPLDGRNGSVLTDLKSGTQAEIAGIIELIASSPINFANELGFAIQKPLFSQLTDLSNIIVPTAETIPDNTELSVSAGNDYVIVRRVNVVDNYAAIEYVNYPAPIRNHNYRFTFQVRVITGDADERQVATLHGSHWLSRELITEADGWQTFSEERVVHHSLPVYQASVSLDLTNAKLGDELHVRYISIEPLTVLTLDSPEITADFDTYYGKVSYPAPFSNAHCLNLNGSDDYIDFGQIPATANASPNDGVIIRMLFKVHTNAIAGRFLATFNANLNTGNSFGIDYQNNGDRHYCRFRTQSQEYREFDIELEEWTMLVASLHDGRLTIRSINKLGDITLSYPSVSTYLSNDGHTVLGATYANGTVGAAFPTSFAFLAIDNYSDELHNMVFTQNPYHRTRSELLRAHFAEGNGDTVYDVSGNGNHGTINSADTSPETGVWSERQGYIGFNQMYGFNVVNDVKIPAIDIRTDALNNSPISHPAYGGRLIEYEGGVNLAADQRGNTIGAFAKRPSNYRSNSTVFDHSTTDIIWRPYYVSSHELNVRADLYMFLSPLTESTLAAAEHLRSGTFN